MNCRRHITAMTVLTSYVLASAAAWLHSVHRCESPTGAVAHVSSPTCCSHQHGQDHAGSSERALLTWQGQDRPAPANPQHRHDECTMCRFQLAKKLVQFTPLLEAVAVVCPERLRLDVPLVRVAGLLATPDSRAPPALA